MQVISKIKVNFEEPVVCGLFFTNAKFELTVDAVGVYRVVFLNQKVSDVPSNMEKCSLESVWKAV